MKEAPMKIPLYNRKHEVVAHATVSPEDYEEISQYRWTLHIKGYAQRTEPGPNHRATILMHRQIMDPPAGLQVDHRDHNKVNNVRENLRLCTHVENSRNRNPVTGSSSRFLGVSWAARDKSWVAWCQGKNLGSFGCEVEAAKAYDVAALVRYGEFARPNFA